MPRSRRGPAQGHEHAEADQREQQVELLLDGDTPELEQRRGPAEQGAVGLAAQQETPVGDVGQAGQRVAGEPLALHRVTRQQRVGAAQCDGGQRGWQEPPGPPCPERAQSHGAVAVALAQDDPRDQEPREREEGGHAEEPALGPGEPSVEGQDGCDGQAAEALEARVEGGRGAPRGERRLGSGAVRTRRRGAFGSHRPGCGGTSWG